VAAAERKAAPLEKFREITMVENRASQLPILFYRIDRYIEVI
jgi:hypothetical protein